MRLIILATVLTTLVSGCSVTKNWQATGGSKSDGTVKLSYQENSFEKVTVSESQGLKEARARCKAWGYEDAEAFGGKLRQCNEYSGGTCSSYLFTKEYQCLDESK